jgi:drug/metabolite transporter (DMT)-like permease
MSNVKGKERILADLAMLLAAIIWGGGFIAQRYGAEHLNHFSFNALRFILASLVLLPMGIRQFQWKMRDVVWMVLAGLCLFAGSALQQAGLATTTASAAGFITGLYVVLVPLYLALFWKTNIPLLNWISAILALFGTYLLSTSGKGFSISSGDLLELMGAFVWPFHLIVVGFAAKKIQPFALSTGQFLVCGLLNLIFSFLSNRSLFQRCCLVGQRYCMAVCSLWQPGSLCKLSANRKPPPPTQL